MDTFSNLVDAVEVLSDPEVKTFFLAILASHELSNEDKYQKIINFFVREGRIRGQMLWYANQRPTDEIDILSHVSQDLHLWNLEELVPQTMESLQRAIRRLGDSQHPVDGGWGFEFAKSDCWATIHAVLCLNSAKTLEGFAFEVDIDEMLKRGIAWLGRNRWAWSVEGIPANEKIFVYELSLVATGFYRTGKDSFGTELSRAVSDGLGRLLLCQNVDGGWEEARNRTLTASQLRTGQHSEVGATSFALRALAEVKNDGVERADFEGAIERGINWLLDVQNEDGSWNYADFVNGYRVKSISKTGDALQGLLVARDLNIAGGQVEARMGKAIEWLQSQEKPILEHGKIGGWGWLKDDLGSFDLENTCLILETLVRMPNASLPLLTPSAQWLIKQQYKEGEDRARDPKDIGKWEYELTARITLSLIEYYKKLRLVSSQVRSEP
jgi:hypothetical protein